MVGVTKSEAKDKADVADEGAFGEECVEKKDSVDG